ncbi:MAG: hypothetical protein M1127_02225 [Patescibacteria group bacterium]|nr:hypothetical protein [Patescibacteria group bacterium]
MAQNISKKTIIIIIAAVLAIGLAVGGYFWWNNLKKSEERPGTKVLENAQEATDKITEDVTKGVLPSIQTNPLENKPDINPAGNANPIKNIKTNPFE